jgi:hypothetical protein
MPGGGAQGVVSENEEGVGVTLYARLRGLISDEWEAGLERDEKFKVSGLDAGPVMYSLWDTVLRDDTGFWNVLSIGKFISLSFLLVLHK